jgi:transmembrane protein EpsG
MTIIWIILFIVTIITLLSEFYRRTRDYASSNGENLNIQPNKFIFSFVIIILVLFSGLRSSIGDTGYYMYSYNVLADELTGLFSYRDWGYYLFQFVLRKISPHPQFLLMVTSLIIITLIFRTLYKYSYPLSLAVFLFITAGSYISTMNGMRQYLVAAIIFYAIELIIKDRKWKFFILVLLLSTIHNSVLIMIPAYFIVKQKAWSKRMLLLIFGSLVIFIGFEKLFGIFSSLIEATQYGNYLDTFGTEVYSGANIVRVFVAAIPVILAFIFRKLLIEKLENYDIYVNFSVLNFLVILFASYNWIFARLGIYFGLYNLILLPSIIKYCFRSKSKPLVGYITIICYIVYFYFDTQPHIYASYFLNINRDLIGPLTRSMYFN